MKLLLKFQTDTLSDFRQLLNFMKSYKFLSRNFVYLKMKKFFALILTVVYMAASSGVVVNVHYCMGKMASVRVDNFSGNQCKCGMKTSAKGCCHNEVKVVKMTNLHKQSVAASYVFAPITLLPVAVSLIGISKTYTSDVNFAVANKPPDLASNKVYLSNCVFII